MSRSSTASRFPPPLPTLFSTAPLFPFPTASSLPVPPLHPVLPRHPVLHRALFLHWVPFPIAPCPLFLTQSVRKCNIKNINIATSQKYVVQHRKTCTATSKKYVLQHQKLYAAISKTKYCNIEKICTATSNKHVLQHMLHHLKW